MKSLAKRKKPAMKKLCVFYEGKNPWVGKKIQWIVCQKCQRNIRNGFCFEATLSDAIRVDNCSAESVAARPGVGGRRGK